MKNESVTILSRGPMFGESHYVYSNSMNKTFLW